MRSVPHSVESISYDNKIFILIQDTLMTYFNNGYIGIKILFEKIPVFLDKNLFQFLLVSTRSIHYLAML